MVDSVLVPEGSQAIDSMVAPDTYSDSENTNPVEVTQ
jgi:hypothetical protein